MKRKVILGIVSLIGLCSFVVLGSSPEFFKTVLESVQNNSIESVFSTSNQNAKAEINEEKPKPLPAVQDENVREIPETVLWYMVFKTNETVEKESEKLVEQENDDKVRRDYFKREAKISDEQAAILREKSAAYLDEIKPIDDKAKEITEKVRATFPKGKVTDKTEIPKPPLELKKLQARKDKTTLRYRDAFREAVGKEAFGQFTNFLENNFSKNIDSGKLELPIEEDSPQYYLLQSTIYWDDTFFIPLISGDALTYFDYNTGLYYDPYVVSVLADETANVLYSYGESIGWGGIFPAQVYHPLFPSVRGHLFCTESAHWALSTLILAPEDVGKTNPREVPDDKLLGNLPGENEPQFSPYDEFLGYTEVCHFVSFLPPTPTPTPTICTPLANGSSPQSEGLKVPCPTPTATPTPTPTPSSNVMISPIDAVEKYGTQEVKVSVSNNANGTTKFTIRTTNGTGRATFQDGSTEVIVNGNVTDMSLIIRGVTESSQADNITIEAMLNNDSTVSAHDEFTVVIITALVFEKFDTSYVNLEDNPGTDGVHTPEEGRRIYPGKKDVADASSGIDRALVKVKATVSPTIPNVKIYFGSYDLDDPSANTVPIDPNGSNGNDNNGTVNNSMSGDFTIPTGINCTDPSTGHIAGKMGCTIVSDGTATAAFKTTMQPGDNFAVAVSLSDIYRDGINLNPNNGAELLNTGNVIHISGEANQDQNAGIRTEMLTVWRKLHIEVDSMGAAHENYVRGNVSGSTTIVRRRSKTINVAAPDLEVNRFENGRLELAYIANFLEVVSNTANTVTVRNSTASDITIANGVDFELNSANGARSALGTISNGQTIASMQTATLTINGTALEVNAFSNGQMFIIPVLRSLTVTGNTANSVEVTNDSPTSIVVADATHFRLYDDDDMDDEDIGNLNGDEGDNVPEPDLSLLSDNDNPASNVFAPAYIRPTCCLSNSHDEIVFVESPTYGQIDALLSFPYFQNFQTEANPEFWTIYLLGGYQPPRYDPVQTALVRDGDPVIYSTTGLIATIYGAANSGSTEVPLIRRHLGTGAIIFAEVGRPNEYPTDYMNRPISRAYTTAHEVGHLFQGLHIDQGLMSPTATRTSGIFSDVSLSLIRQTTFP